MAYRVTPYAYRPGSTFLHRMPGGLKLLGLFLISMAPFFSNPGILLSGFLIILGSISAKIPPWELLRGSRPIAGIALCVSILRSMHFNDSESGVLEFNYPGCMSGILFGLGLILSFSAGALLFSVTTMTELRDSLGRLETTLRSLPRLILKKDKTNPVHPPNTSRLSWLSLGISLMLGFLPRFFEIWEAADLAYQARAGKKGIPKLFLLIPLITERMIEIAVETATALESRGASL